MFDPLILAAQPYRGQAGGKEMASSSDAFLGLGLDDGLTRRQVLQAGLVGAATIGLAACGQAEPTGGGTTGPDFKVGAVLPSSKVYAELRTDITHGMKVDLG